MAGIVEFLGWFGAVTVLAGYLLFSMGKLTNGPVYQLFNLVGGLAVAINVAAHHAIPSTIVNGIWAIVAVVVLIRMARARRAARRGAPSASTSLLGTEPLAVTAVLPVIGPVVRHHEPDATDEADAAPRLAAANATPNPIQDAATPNAPTPTPTTVAPMTESIPVITATIALAIVAAAQQRADPRQQDDHADRPADADRLTPAEPHHAAATPA